MNKLSADTLDKNQASKLTLHTCMIERQAQWNPNKIQAPKYLQVKFLTDFNGLKNFFTFFSQRYKQFF